MKISDSTLSNNLKELLDSYLRNNQIDFDTTINESKTLILHINVDNTNVLIHDKGKYKGFVSKKK